MCITDFEAWLDEADLENFEEIYSLYWSVANCDVMGLYKTKVANGNDNGWIVSADYCDDSLHLCSEMAKKAFLSLLEKRFCDGMDMETWYAVEYANSKDD